MRAGCLAVCLAIAAAAATGCDPLAPQIFVASAWNEADACLEKGGAVDVYDDDDPEACNDATRCWRSPDNEIYVSTACEAPIGWDRLPSGEDPRCEEALAAWDLGDEGRCDE